MTMLVEEFQHILNLGLGRAVLYLQQNDSTSYREAILNACLHNTAYDKQVEGTRATYMHDIIQLTPDVDFYRDAILTALSQPLTGDWDDEHLLAHAGIFAKAGDEAARQLIYECLLERPSSNPPYQILVDVDGLNGLIKIVDKIWSSDLDARNDFLSFDGDYLWSRLDERDGIDQTRLNLLAVSETNPNIKEYIDAVSALRAKDTYSIKRKRRSNKSHRSNISYDDLKTWISNAPNLSDPPIAWSLWGKFASDEDIALAANDLLHLPEDEVRTITIYLDMFRNRMFPLDPTRLINWARQIDDRSIWNSDGTIDYEARRSLYALNALELVMDWAVRDLALSLIGSKNNAGRAVELLGLNFVKGDWQLIEELSQANTNPDDYHSLGLSVRDIFDAHPTDESAAVFLNLYEFGPCSACRERFVRKLASLNAVPSWMLEECKYDSNLDLREWALQLS